MYAGRRGRQNVCVWQTWQGYYLHVSSWSLLHILCFLVFYKKISLKEREIWQKVISKQIINCHACLTSVWSLDLRLLTSPVLLRKFTLKIRGRRRPVKRRFKSEFAVSQSSSRLFHLACLSNVCDLSWSWIPKSLIQVKKEKENYVVACLRCMMLHETIRNDDF